MAMRRRGSTLGLRQGGVHVDVLIDSHPFETTTRARAVGRQDKTHGGHEPDMRLHKQALPAEAKKSTPAEIDND